MNDKELFDQVPMDREDLIGDLEYKIECIKNLPPKAMQTPVTHYDLLSTLSLLRDILRAT